MQKLRRIQNLICFIFLSDKRVTSPLLRAITLKYSKYFNYGVVRKPSQEIMHNFQIKQIPTTLVVIATESVSGDKKILQFSSVFYDTKLYGGISYLNLTRFFYSVHEKHWAEHPDAKKSVKGKLGLRELYIDELKEIVSRDGFTFSEEGRDDETDKGSREVEITFENHKRVCTDSALGLCLIYFVDANNREAVKEALRLYEDLQEMPSIKGKAVLR